MNFSPEENACVSISSVHLRLRERLFVVVVHSVAYFWAALHSDLSYLLCVLRELHADSPVGGLTWPPDCSVLLQDEEKKKEKKKSRHGLVPFIVSLRWVHFIYSCVPLALARTSGVQLDKNQNYWCADEEQVTIFTCILQPVTCLNQFYEADNDFSNKRYPWY